MFEKITGLVNQIWSLRKGGGDAQQAKIKEIGLLTARERIDILLDKGSFNEIDLFVEHTGREFGMAEKKLPGDGVITGYGKIGGRSVCVYSQDVTVKGGSLGNMHAKKIAKVMDLASDMGVPIIGINDSGGARIEEGVDSLAGYGEIFYRNTINSGKIPQISVIVGHCAGGAVYSPAITDFIFMVDKQSHMFVTGPKVTEAAISQKVSSEELGGARIHATKTGNIHFYTINEQLCFDKVKRLLNYIPSSWDTKPPAKSSVPPSKKVDIAEIIPEDTKKAYNVRDVIEAIVDESEFLEVQRLFAENAVVGFARLSGRSIGIVANQPSVKTGCMDVDSSDKVARFVRFCDAFGIPLLTFVDLTGYLPGFEQEHAGIIRHGAKTVYAYAEATVPKISVVLRKAYGGGYIAMSSKHLRTDLVFALPSAEIAVMGAEPACNVIFAKEIAAAENPEAVRNQRIKEYEEKFSNPYRAAAKGYVDEIIHPDMLRDKLIQSFDLLSTKKPTYKQHKHGCIPL